MGKSRLAHAPLGQRPQALADCLHREDQSSPFDWHEALVFVEADEAVVQSIDNDEFARSPIRSLDTLPQCLMQKNFSVSPALKSAIQPELRDHECWRESSFVNAPMLPSGGAQGGRNGENMNA